MREMLGRKRVLALAAIVVIAVVAGVVANAVETVVLGIVGLVGVLLVVEFLGNPRTKAAEDVEVRMHSHQGEERYIGPGGPGI